MTKATRWRNKAIEERVPLTPRDSVDDSKKLPMTNGMEEKKACGECVPLTPWCTVKDTKELPMTLLVAHASWRSKILNSQKGN